MTRDHPTRTAQTDVGVDASVEESTASVCSSNVAALDSLLGDRDAPVKSGATLPPLWHWAAVPQWHPLADLGPDGHPARLGLPPTGFPRRMFAGGEVVFHQNIEVGAHVRKTTQVTSVEPKAARSGPIIVVGITTNLRALDETLLLTERQDIVYRAQDDRLIDQRIDQRNSSTGAALDSSPVEPTRQEPVRQVMRRDDGSWRLQTDPTILMRFSAATSNGHRIHYDWPYATQVEGYPGLVVQGPLTTLALLETLRRDHRDQRVARVRHRNVGPLFCGDQAVIEIKPFTRGSSTTTADLVLRRPTGQTITTATATLKRTSERNVHA